MTSAARSVRLYQLALGNGCSASPYVWRIRYALAHKGVACEPVPVGFTGIPTILGGRFKTVPILEHGATLMAESWDIAEYLDKAFPGTPELFSSPAELAMVRFTDAWFTSEILRKMFGIYVLDIHNAARPEDRAYFRRTREMRLKGATLEEFTADRAARLPALRDALTPMRAYLARSPYIGGGAPGSTGYAISMAGSAATRACKRCSNNTEEISARRRLL